MECPLPRNCAWLTFRSRQKLAFIKHLRPLFDKLFLVWKQSCCSLIWLFYCIACIYIGPSLSVGLWSMDLTQGWTDPMAGGPYRTSWMWVEVPSSCGKEVFWGMESWLAGCPPPWQFWLSTEIGDHGGPGTNSPWILGAHWIVLYWLLYIAVCLVKWILKNILLMLI